MLVNLAWVAAGGALGAAARYLVSVAVHTPQGFPAATLAVNVAGSLAIGVAWGAWAHLPWFQEWGRAFLAIGILGGFTTFSAFSLEALTLLHTDRFALAAIYVASSLAGCLMAVWLGYGLAVN
ncbi:MAG: fluoride efflux transporter CrcB [Gammaproteobacteria bacterium]|nr:fluoride efflux transporter CrcB [Gammaproteobacteria bacterium]